jgi:hypothetical protein
MARKRSAAKGEADMLDPQAQQLAIPGAHGRHDARDPREPLPTGVANHDDVPRLQTVEASDARLSKDLATVYARNLIAFDGDVIRALAATFGVSEDEATARMRELHERARGASRATTSIGEMFERHDVTSEVRIAKLREMMFSPQPAAALKAIDVLNDLDATQKAKRIGTTWETFVTRVRAGAGPLARQAREQKPLSK